MTAHVEQLEFQAEARQLLDLMVHSVYSNKDSFLRELISNASDALDKLRLEAFRNKDLNVDTSDLHIDIEVDKEARTLTIRDNGIGMTREEVVDLIGTLAKSGTAELRQQLREAKNAGRLRRTDRSVRYRFLLRRSWWPTRSSCSRVRPARARPPGGNRAAMAPTPSNPSTTLRRERRSPCTSSPRTPRTNCTTTPRSGRSGSWSRSTPTSSPGPSGWRSSDVPRPAEEGGEETVTVETQTLNSMKALWARSKDEVSDEEYKEFYKHIAHAWDDPLEVIAMKAEGTFEYQALLFIPSHAPFDLFNRDAKIGVQLYVKRVFIMGDCDQLMPRILALRQGRRRRTGHVAQRFSRNPAAGSAGQGDPSPSDQKGPVDDQGSAVRAAARTTARSGPSSAGSSKRA